MSELGFFQNSWTGELMPFAFSFDNKLVAAGVIFYLDKEFKMKPENASLVCCHDRIIVFAHTKKCGRIPFLTYVLYNCFTAFQKLFQEKHIPWSSGGGPVLEDLY